LTEALRLCSEVGLARGHLLRELRSASFQSLHKFSDPNLVSLGMSLAKLRMLTSASFEELLAGITDVSALKPASSVALLLTMAWVDGGDAATYEKVAAQVVAATQSLHVGHLCDAAWALAARPIGSSSELAAVCSAAFEQKPSQQRAPLLRMSEAVAALELEYPDVEVSLPGPWRTILEDVQRMDQDRLETAGMHRAILDSLDRFTPSPSFPYEIQFTRNAVAGRYRVEFLDEKNGLCLEVDTLNRVVPPHMKVRHLKLQTATNQKFKYYYPAVINYWNWRRIRDPEDQELTIKRMLKELMTEREQAEG